MKRKKNHFLLTYMRYKVYFCLILVIGDLVGLAETILNNYALYNVSII